MTICYSIALISGLAMLFHGIDNQEAWYFPLMVVFAEYGIAAVFTIIFVSHTQIFPVLLSTTTLGVCNLASRIVATQSPILAQAE